MLTYSVFYAGLTISGLDEPRLGITPEDAVGSNHELFKLLLSKYTSSDDLLIKLPDRKRHNSSNIDRRAVFVPRVVDFPVSQTIIFDFWKIHYDLDDRKIFDDSARKVDHLKDLISLRDTQGALIEGICAYDYKMDVFIWRDIQGISKSDIENFLYNLIGRKVTITNLYDANSDSDFALMDVESINIDVETADVNATARALSNNAGGRSKIAERLASIAETSNAGRIQFKLYADSKNSKSYLNREVLSSEIVGIRKLLALANSARKRRDFRGKFRAEGRIKNTNPAIIEPYEHRVIDLFKGLLIKKVQVPQSDDPQEQESLIDQAMINLVNIGRNTGFTKEEGSATG